MADISRGGNPIDDKTRKLAARRAALRRMELELAIARKEIEMDETRDRAERQVTELADLKRELEAKLLEIQEIEKG